MPETCAGQKYRIDAQSMRAIYENEQSERIRLGMLPLPEFGEWKKTME